MAGAPSLLSLLMKPRECAAAVAAAPAAAAVDDAPPPAAQTSPANLMHQFGRRKSADEMRDAGASPISYVSGLLSASCRPAHGDPGVDAPGPWAILPSDDFDEFGDHADFALGDERPFAAAASFPASFLARPLATRPSVEIEPMFPLGDAPELTPALA